jgi:hypothetical protein
LDRAWISRTLREPHARQEGCGFAFVILVGRAGWDREFRDRFNRVTGREDFSGVGIEFLSEVLGAGQCAVRFFVEVGARAWRAAVRSGS